MASVQEILAKSRELSLDFKSVKTSTTPVGEPYKPNPLIQDHLKKKYFEVLAPKDYVWSDRISEHYITEPWDKPKEYPGRTVIIHGHGRDKGCALPYQCHVLGFTPVGWPEPFMKSWREKWE